MVSTGSLSSVSPHPDSGLRLSSQEAPGTGPWPREAGSALLFGVASAVLLLVSVLRTGWVSDDAFITIRSVENLLAGEGWGINPGTRLQAFTSPLWAFLCIPFLWATGDPYLALVLPGLLCTLGLVVLIMKALRTFPWHAPVVLVALLSSGSFVAFSTSGLENSLTHLLAAAFGIERIARGNRPTATVYWLGAGLFLTRFDLALLVLPTLVSCTAGDLKRALRRAVAPAIAVGAWLTFATVYFGFPYPNTAYAKLYVELPLSSRLGRGLEYLLDSVSRDPVVILAVLCTSVLVFRRAVPWSLRALQGGVVLYLAYVVGIGGDFMSGRFLTSAYLLSALVGVRVAFMFTGALSGGRTALGLALVLVVVAGAHLQGSSPQNPTECHVSITGIVDERGCYVEHTGLAQNVMSDKWRTHGYLADFRKTLKKTKGDVVAFDLVGMAGYGATRRVHVVERFALSDPLLARMRVRPDGNWRAGHFIRDLPEGYLESLSTGQNLLTDPCLHDLHADLVQVTRGRLWSKERFKAIWRLNTGKGAC